jgi:hypothetical protein
MTKSDLKQIIKSIIVECINESKLQEKTPEGFPKKLKKKILKQYPGKAGKAKAYATMQKVSKSLDEQETPAPEMSDIEAEPEIPSTPETPVSSEDQEHTDLLGQLDSIIGSLNSLREKLSGHAGETQETEPVSEVPPQVDNVEESSDEELGDEDEDEFINQYDDDESMKNVLAWQRTSGERLGYDQTEEEDDFDKKIKYIDKAKRKKGESGFQIRSKL